MSQCCSTTHNYFGYYFSSIKIALTCSVSSHLCFLWSKWYFIVISRKLLWSNLSSICFSFNHNINHFYIVHSAEVSGYSINTLLTEIDLSWLTYESIKALAIKTAILFNLYFPNNTILSYLFFLFYNWFVLFNSCSDCANVYSY